MRAVRLLDERKNKQRTAVNPSVGDLLHELEVHRAELEIQNEALREAEAALRQARNRYFDQFDLAPIPYVILAGDSMIEEANLAMASLVGCERKELRDTRLSSFVAPQDVRTFQLYLREVVETGRKLGIELMLWRRDGSVVPARLDSILVNEADRDSDEADSARIRTTLVDLSEIRRARIEIEKGAKELDVTKAQLDSVARSMLDSLVLIDDAGVIQSVNQATLSLLDYEESELVGQFFGKVMKGLDRGAFEPRRLFRDDSDAADLGPKILGRSEAFYIAKSGTEIPVDFAGSLVDANRDGQVRAIACLAHDITDDRLKDEQLRLTVEAAPIAMLMLDHEHRIVLLNAKSEELFGYAREELLGQEIDILVPPSELERHRAFREPFLNAVAVKKVSAHREFLAKCKDGTEIPVEVALSPFAMTAGPRVLATVADLSERKRLEEQLRQSQKMEAIGTLASGVAHDFNNLLMGVGGCADIALSTLDPASPTTMYLDEIKRSAASGAAISRQLLAFSAKRELQVSVFDLNALIAQARNMLSRMLGESIEVTAELAEDACRVRSDPSEIERVLINLAINARDALPHGGKVRIETSVLKLPDATRHVSPGYYVALSFSDTGSGMTAEVQKRIFEPFFTTKESGRGTGLGLSVVYGIVQQAGGRIEVKSAPDRGTSFELFFPAVQEPLTKELKVPPVEITQQPSCHRTVLLLEDDPTVRMATRFYLERGGFTVLEAGTASEAIECCKNYSKTIDLLLTDVALPGMDGQRAALEIQHIRSDIKVLYISALGADRECSVENQIVEKPFDSSVLLTRIHKVLDEEEPAGSPGDP